MNFERILDFVLQYAPEIIECLVDMDKPRRDRLFNLMNDPRSRTLVLRLVDRLRDDDDFVELMSVVQQSLESNQ